MRFGSLQSSVNLDHWYPFYHEINDELSKGIAAVTPNRVLGMDRTPCILVLAQARQSGLSIPGPTGVLEPRLSGTYAVCVTVIHTVVAPELYEPDLREREKSASVNVAPRRLIHRVKLR